MQLLTITSFDIAKGGVVNSQTDGNGDNEKGNKDDNNYYNCNDNNNNNNNITIIKLIIMQIQQPQALCLLTLRLKKLMWWTLKR